MIDDGSARAARLVVADAHLVVRRPNGVLFHHHEVVGSRVGRSAAA